MTAEQMIQRAADKAARIFPHESGESEAARITVERLRLAYERGRMDEAIDTIMDKIEATLKHIPPGNAAP